MKLSFVYHFTHPTSGESRALDIAREIAQQNVVHEGGALVDSAQGAALETATVPAQEGVSPKDAAPEGAAQARKDAAREGTPPEDAAQGDSAREDIVDKDTAQADAAEKDAAVIAQQGSPAAREDGEQSKQLGIDAQVQSLRNQPAEGHIYTAKYKDDYFSLEEGGTLYYK